MKNSQPPFPSRCPAGNLQQTSFSRFTNAGKAPFVHKQCTRHSRSIALALGLGGLALLSPKADAYTVTAQSGPNLIAVHQNLSPNNGLNTAYPGATVGSTVYLWDVPNQQFTFVDYHNGTAWMNNQVVTPGMGVLFLSSAAGSQNFTMSGTPASGGSVTLVPGQFYLKGNASATAGTTPGTFNSIVGSAPPVTGVTWLFRWDAVNDTYIPRRFTSGSWGGPTPTVPVGESVFVANFAAGLLAPNVINAKHDCDGVGAFVRVFFDRDVDPLTAATLGNYALTGPSITLTAAEPEYDLGNFGLIPRPLVRTVKLRAASWPVTGSFIVTAPGVKGMGGTPVNPASSAPVQIALEVKKISVDCGGNQICLTFNQNVSSTSVMLLANYAVSWVDLSTSASGAIPVTSIFHNSGTNGNVICLTLSSVPAGNILFTVTLDSTTATPLTSVCGDPLVVTPTYTISAKCNPVVQGRVFRHQSAPVCAQDFSTSLYGIVPNEFALAGRQLVLDDGLDKYYGVTDANGDYKITAPAGSYTLDLMPQPNWMQQCPVGSVGIPLTIVGGATYAGNNFSADPTSPFSDLCIYLHYRFGIVPGLTPIRTYNSPCCGQPMTVVARYQNKGTEVVLGATVQITLPGQSWIVLSSTASTPALSAPTSGGGVLTWTIPALLPGQSGTVEATIMLNCTGGSVQTISSAAAITLPAGDPTATDNASGYSQQTLCSYDPNDKTVEPKGCGPEGFVPVGTEFEYFIQFQNTGNGPAYRVLLSDFLDPDLDLNTIQVLSSSHAYVFTVDAGTREMLWTMDDINLPGTYDEPNSHGFVRYKVKHNVGAPVGTEITNRCAIIFDVNVPVLTAITTNTLSSSTPPSSAFSASTTTPGVGVPMSFTYTGGTLGANYLWDFGASATPATSTAANPSGIVYSTSGAKLPTLMVTQNGCESVATVGFITASAPPGCWLNIARNGSGVSLSWTNAAFRLQGATNLLTAPWINVSGSSPVSLPASGNSRFFRLTYP